MNIQQILLTLKARYKIGIFVLLLIVTAVLAYTFSSPKKYEATASVLLDIKSTDPLVANDSLAATMNSYMPTQVDIIKSSRVAQKVVQQLNLDKNPTIRSQWMNETKGKGQLVPWLGNLLKRGLSVKPSENSNIIDITFTSKDPAFASTLANAFAQAYIDTNLELKVEPARQYAAWFQERVKGLREDLEKAQGRLSAYQQKTGIVLTDDQQPGTDRDKIAQLSTELSMTEGKTADLQSKR
ncbi:MAG TPA: Wzz/FepE/Etk N-terminal domain-containing protein, partial [Burkholderiales bacterium]|nr:Wzz/FepE/Etk N-terminal domain-containing protein [Burkholderiales bacterium]